MVCSTDGRLRVFVNEKRPDPDRINEEDEEDEDIPGFNYYNEVLIEGQEVTYNEEDSDEEDSDIIDFDSSE